MRYEIGQEVWWARFENTESSVECPDCAGDCVILCIMGDGTEVTVDCQNCSAGYAEFSRGRIRTYDRRPFAVKTTISGMDIRSATNIEYRIPESYIVREALLFETEAECLTKAKEIAVEASREELDRITHKEKDTRSWSWNATYHRKCIRDAKKQIEYHTRKLDVASEKAKAQKTHD